MPAQLGDLLLDDLVAECAALPDLVDQLVLGHEITVTLCKRKQHVEDHGLGTFELLATSQDSLGRQDIPVSEAETSV